MDASKKHESPPPNLEHYDRLVQTFPEVPRKGASVPYTSLNGNMFSYLHSSGRMALRLPRDDREKFLEKYKKKLFEAHGIIQKEYVTVPESLLFNTDELSVYFGISFRYVQTLKPKPTKKAAKP